MIRHIFIILLYQLIGEAISHAGNLPLPGPVLGLVFLVATFIVYPPLYEAIKGTVNNLLMHLSLLFVPAGVGVVQYMDLMKQEGLQIVIAILVSSVLTLGITAFTFQLVARWTDKQTKEPAE